MGFSAIMFAVCSLYLLPYVPRYPHHTTAPIRFSSATTSSSSSTAKAVRIQLALTNRRLPTWMNISRQTQNKFAVLITYSSNSQRKPYPHPQPPNVQLPLHGQDNASYPPIRSADCTRTSVSSVSNAPVGSIVVDRLGCKRKR